MAPSTVTKMLPETAAPMPIPEDIARLALVALAKAVNAPSREFRNATKKMYVRFVNDSEIKSILK